MSKPVRVRSAAGLKWKKRRFDVYEARWQCRDDIAAKGYAVKSVKLWSGTGEPTKEEWDFMADTCEQLQQEMLVWNRGGLPAPVVFNGTIAGLIYCYRNDPDSVYRKKGGLRHASKIHYDALMRLIEKEFGTEQLALLKARTFLRWHESWAADGKVSIAHAKMGMLRGLFTFGSTMLEDEECARLSGIMSGMKFPQAAARTERLTAEQATLVRAKLHEMGWPSVALAQAIQFECMFRQKDVIGEYVPLSEPGVTDVVAEDKKWLRGIRWEEIDATLTLRHVTSKRGKAVTVNLRNAPMVMEEFATQFPDGLPTKGPVILHDLNRVPWEASDFRYHWRKAATAAGLPKTVRNMDSRAGAISEATDGGADLEHVRHAATHSNISMTQRYSRGSEDKIANVQKLRVEFRNKGRTE